MGDILKKITELLSEGADIEQHRSTGIIIRSNVNWFDAIDSADDNGGVKRTSEKNALIGKGDEEKKDRVIQQRRYQALNDIP